MKSFTMACLLIMSMYTRCRLFVLSSVADENIYHSSESVSSSCYLLRTYVLLFVIFFVVVEFISA